MGQLWHFFKSLGTLIAIALFGLTVWGIREWSGISDTTVLSIIILILYFVSRYENCKLQDVLDDLKIDFELHQKESGEEIFLLKRRIEVICEDINEIHPDGENRHLKKMGLQNLIDFAGKNGDGS